MQKQKSFDEIFLWGEKITQRHSETKKRHMPLMSLFSYILMRLVLTTQLRLTKGKIVTGSIILNFHVLKFVKLQIYNMDHKNKSQKYKKNGPSEQQEDTLKRPVSVVSRSSTHHGMRWSFVCFFKQIPLFNRTPLLTLPLSQQKMTF